MTRKPIKIANNLDLSGNQLIDVSKIYRKDSSTANLGIEIKAGSNPSGTGGSLLLTSGEGTSSAGSISLKIGEMGLVLQGDTTATISTNNKDINLTTGTGSVKPSGNVVVGGNISATNITLSGGDIVAATATAWNILNTVATTVNAFGDATSVTLGKSTNATLTIPSTKASTSKTTGALVIGGGVGISGALYAGGLLSVADDIILPSKATPGSTLTGSMIWNSTSKLLTIYDGTSRKVYVDTNSTQSLSNKTYNALTLTANATGFQITGGTTTATLSLEKNLTVNTGAVTLKGASTGSTLTLPSSLTVNALSKANVLYTSSAGTISGKATLDVPLGGTGLATFTQNVIYKGDGKNKLKVSSITDDGSLVSLANTVDFSLKGNLLQAIDDTDATPAIQASYMGTKSEASIAYSFISKASATSFNKTAMYVEASTGAASNVYAVYSKASGGTTNYSFYGAGGTLYNKDPAVFANSVALNSGVVTSTSTSFSLLNNQKIDLTMLTSANSSLVIGSDSASTHNTTIYSNIVVGSSSNRKNITTYGGIQFGGSSGYTLGWNSTDNSLDFIKVS